MPAMESDGDDFDPKRILVVDDDGPMLRTHGRVLEAHGFHPILMPDAGEALEEAKSNLPSVIVLDLVMPGMSGLEYVARLRSYYGRTAPPLVLVSAHHHQLSPMEQLMFDAIFPKPYSVDGVIATVKKLARDHQERRRAPSEVVLKRGARPPYEEDEGEA
jgi:DNA-binding response OmpR family regulator